MYYRSALALDPQNPAARAVWREAWRLIAGLPPMRVRYYCIYD